MDIGSIASYTALITQLKGTTDKSRATATGFVNVLQAENPGQIDEKEAYIAHLKEKYGFNIRVESVEKDQKSLDRAGGTLRGNGLIIASNMLEKMAREPETASRIEGHIDRALSNIPKLTAEFAAKGLTFRSEGFVVHEDGTITHICGCEDSPERVAEVKRINKEKREKEAEQLKEIHERAMEAAAERRSHLAEVLQERQPNAVNIRMADAVSAYCNSFVIVNASSALSSGVTH